RRSAAASSASPSKPASKSPSTARLASALARVSVSPKRSATTARRPARRAATARARADKATSRYISGSANELTRQGEGIAEIDEERFSGLDQPAEQPGLHLVLEAADGERPDADCLRTRQRRAVVLRAQTRDAGGRHGVDVSGDLQRSGVRQLRSAQDRHSRATRRQDHLR